MPNRKPAGLRVAVVGATGLVGRELLKLLEDRRFPVSELIPASSGRTAQKVPFRGRRLAAPAVDEKLLRSCSLVFFASSDEVSRKLAPKLARKGIWVIDDSSAFRLDSRAPLVIPEVNFPAITKGQRLIAGPNCTLTGLAVAANLLRCQYQLLEVRLASYQSVSGAGREALEEFSKQNGLLSKTWKALSSRVPVLPRLDSAALPQQIAFNVIPQVGELDSEGHSGEEVKVSAELKKIWGMPGLKISATAVRVPVLRGHSLAVWLTFKESLTPARARQILRRTPGVRLADPYPTPISLAGDGAVHVGRIRQGTAPNEICLWIVSDNLLKGAALNSVQIAEGLLSRGRLVPGI
ncbi:MAG: aspartate-semialdehyde dehydrogenase [Elusimicrobia bacterium]|nr:aspartate-semialdehyde dehydrogenase [Elusimicrobiota bacterium]